MIEALAVKATVAKVRDDGRAPPLSVGKEERI
jgi:hypothetical protein